MRKIRWFKKDRSSSDTEDPTVPLLSPPDHRAEGNAWAIFLNHAIDDARDLRRYLSFNASSTTEVSYSMPILGSNVLLVMARSSLGYVVGAFGSHPTARRWLNDSVVSDTRLHVDEDSRQIHLYFVDPEVEAAAAKFIEFARLVRFLRSKEEAGGYTSDEYVNAYWSSGVVNFGDWLGPHLLRRMTGLRPVQSNRIGLPSPSLFSVGSVAGWFKQNDVGVWGSGLIKPLTEQEVKDRRKLRGINVFAVRGKLTQEHLERSLGWTVPDVYGDPGLLLPRVYESTRSSSGKVALVPHGVHQRFFDGVDPDAFDVVNVRADFRDVVDSIASARCVVSTSLHGLVIAQAYGVPWVWLCIEDRPLWGADFKFFDFFSTLEADAVATRRVVESDLSSLDLWEVSSEANLPQLRIELDRLWGALPLKTESGHSSSSDFTHLDYSLRDISLMR